MRGLFFGSMFKLEYGFQGQHEEENFNTSQSVLSQIFC
jgi:hypothetical protein